MAPMMRPFGYMVAAAARLARRKAVAGTCRGLLVVSHSGSTMALSAKPREQAFSLVSALLLLGLAGCERKAEQQVAQQVEAERATKLTAEPGTTAGDERISCALASSEQLAPVCRIERSQSERGTVLTMRHPDGGFRRLLVVQDGRGVLAADGAEPAQVTLVGGKEIDVAIGRDRYRLPALRKASSP